MFSDSRIADEVLAAYPSPCRGELIALGNHGGFSGARLWRVKAAAGDFCLKAWPIGERTASELAWIHQLLAKLDTFTWVPRVLASQTGTTVISAVGRLWDLQTWMPGRADYHETPTDRKLRGAMTALGRLHRCWESLDVRFGIAPVVLRRWATYERWDAEVRAGWAPIFSSSDFHAPAAERLWRVVRIRAAEVPLLLTRWRAVSLPTQPCVCDPWHDHVLFTGDTVTGLIDFGSAKIDHVAVDLTRLVGSMVGDDPRRWRVAIDAYHAVRPVTDEEVAFARNLDRVGVILAAANWLLWLYRDERKYTNREAVEKRMRTLADRLENGSHIV